MPEINKCLGKLFFFRYAGVIDFPTIPKFSCRNLGISRIPFIVPTEINLKND